MAKTLDFVTKPNKYNVAPTQAELDALYAGTSLAGVVQCVAGIQKFIIPVSATYTITAKGASGGKGSGPAGATTGAGYVSKGAIVRGDFKLNKNDELYMIVGHKGQDSSSSGGGDAVTAGGGGMSAVAVKDDTSSLVLTFNGQQIKVRPLIVAGGGSGGGDAAYGNATASDADLTEGNDSYLANNLSGGGFSNFRSDNTCGKSFLAGGAAAINLYTRYGYSSWGGFGGAGGNSDDGRGGGGGGWKGGSIGYGGSCYNSGANPYSVLRTDIGDGSIRLEYTPSCKKLVLSGGNYHTYENNAWSNIGPTLTDALFTSKGMDSLDYSKLSLLPSPKIIGFAESTEAISITLNIVAKKQLLTRKVGYALNGKKLVGITIDAEASTRFLFGTDGVTWQAYRDSAWTTVNIADLDICYANAMTHVQANALTKGALIDKYTTTLYVLMIVEPTDTATTVLRSIQLSTIGGA